VTLAKIANDCPNFSKASGQTLLRREMPIAKDHAHPLLVGKFCCLGSDCGRVFDSLEKEEVNYLQLVSFSFFT